MSFHLMTLNDLYPGFKDHGTFQRRISCRCIL